MRVQCPSCSKLLDAPDEKAGQVVKCSACGAQMQLPTLPASQPAAPRPGGGMPVGPGAGAAGPGATKACRFCGEQILAVAQKCKHCGSYLTGPRAGRGGRTGSSSSSSQGTTALVLAIIAMVTSCFPLLPLILGGLAVYFARRARAGGDNSGATTAGLVVGIVATVFGVLTSLYWVVVMAVAITRNA